MGTKDHIHRYIAVFGRKTKKNSNSGFHGYYKCADPDCTHRQKAELIIGKRSICNRCGGEFILPIAVDALRARPHCKKCTRKYPSRGIKRSSEIIQMSGPPQVISTERLNQLSNEALARMHTDEFELEVED